MACTCGGTAPGYPQHESGCGQDWDEDGLEQDADEFNHGEVDY